jgi:carbon-monoxide dehydrogenase small subunit
MVIDGAMHPPRRFHRNHGLQCGFGTPDDAAAAFLKENPTPTEEDVRKSLEGNLCRCTGYQNIVTSILDAAGQTSAASV